MAFENVFRGIDFQAPVRADAQRQQQFLNILGSSIAQAQQKNQFDERMKQAEADRLAREAERAQDLELRRQQLELQRQKLEQPGSFNLNKAAQQAATQFALTGNITPEGQAAIAAYEAFQRPQVDPLTGYVMPPANVMQNLGMGQAQQMTQAQPVAPILPDAVTQPEMAMGPQPMMQPQSDAQGASFYERTPAVQKQVAQTRAVEEAKKGVKGLERFNEGQLQSANFAGRMVQSNEIFDELKLSDPEASTARTGILGGVAEALAILPFGDFGSSLGDAVVRIGGSPEQQRYLNAADNWISANLRKESGAVIGAEEKANEYRKYFPIAGDSGAVIEQKAKLRDKVTKGMIAQSAGAYEEAISEKDSISNSIRDGLKKGGFTDAQINEYMKLRGMQ